MTANPWSAIWENPQRRLAYVGFVSALLLLTWLIFLSAPPLTGIYSMDQYSLRRLPTAWALTATGICALLFWPLFYSTLSGLAPFIRGAFCGVMILATSSFAGFFSYLAFGMATEPNTQWGIILGPIAFMMFLFIPQTWISLVASAVIGLFAAAFSEAVL